MALLGFVPLVIVVGAFWFVLKGWRRIITNAGFSTRDSIVIGVGMLIPLVNFGAFFWFAFTKWPVMANLKETRGELGQVVEHLRGETPTTTTGPTGL